MNTLSLPMDILGRTLLGLYFLVPGVMKITGFSGMQAYMAQHGVPLVTPLLVLTILLQVGCGLALIAGWQTRLAAFLLAGLTLLICVFMHDFWNRYEGGNQQHEMQNFIKNLGIFAGLLILAARGARRAARLGRRSSKQQGIAETARRFRAALIRRRATFHQATLTFRTSRALRNDIAASKQAFCDACPFGPMLFDWRHSVRRRMGTATF